MVVAIIFLGLAIGLAVLAYRRFRVGPASQVANHPAEPGDSEPAPAAALPAPESAGPFLNAGSDATYVGSGRCAECHQDEHASYLQTAHSQSLNLVDPVNEPADAEFDHSSSGLRYEVHRQENRLWHRESLPRDGGEPIVLADHPLVYRVGSGRFASTYVAEIDGFLVESPVTWYASSQSWRMSPGYDVPVHHSFQRGVSDDCLFCHAGRTSNPTGSLAKIEIHELAIACERCHGPGSLHVARHQAAAGAPGEAADWSIVNPGRLGREFAEAICHQCHLESVGNSLVQGRSREQFRPGLQWADFCVNYEPKSSSQQMTVTGHVQQMHASRCYQQSTTLTCITCHDLHSQAPPAGRTDTYRTACLSCHADSDCNLPATVREERNRNDCAACHMPRSPTDVPHVAFTHHRIGIHDDLPELPHDEFAVVEFEPVLKNDRLPEAHRRRNLGLAYLQRYVNSWQDSRLVWYRDQAEELLGGAFEQGLRDEAVLTGLATIAGERGELTLTAQLAEQALARGEISAGDGIAARNLLANVYYHQQRFADAESVLHELIRLRREPRDWVLLGRCREQQNNVVGAIAALLQVVKIDAKMPETYEVLSELYLHQGDRDVAREHLQRAEELRARSQR